MTISAYIQKFILCMLTHTRAHTHTQSYAKFSSRRKINDLVELLRNRNFRVTECVLTLFTAEYFGIFLLGFYSARVNQSYPRDILIYSGIVTACRICTLKLD